MVHGPLGYKVLQLFHSCILSISLNDGFLYGGDEPCFKTDQDIILLKEVCRRDYLSAKNESQLSIDKMVFLKLYQVDVFQTV